MSWLPFAVSLVVFLAAHIVPMLPALRARLIARIGRRGYFAAYGAASLLLFGWVIHAAGAAPFEPLADPPLWSRWAVNIAMPLAVALAVFGLATPNPFGMGRAGEGFAPERPGILGLTRHPLMWSFALWAGGHLIANPDLAHAILFGLMLVFALAGVAMGEARGAEAVARLGKRTSALPFVALLAGRWRPRAWPSLRLVVLTLAIWAALLWLHPLVIGVSPLP